MRTSSSFGAALAKIAAALFAGVVLCGCSAVKLGYNNLPDIAYWWLDGYVDFNGAQTPRVREQLPRLLEWHRRNELPKMLAVVEKAERLASADLTSAQVCALGNDVRKSLLATALEAARPGAELAASLGDAQLRRLDEKYAKNNAAYASDWLERSISRQHEKRYGQFLERSEDFYGALDDAQRTLLRRIVDRSVFDPRRVDAERRRRQQESLAMLRGSGNGSAPVNEVRVALETYARQISEPPAGPWRDYQQALIVEGCDDIAELHNATRPAQREQAVRRLQAYAQDLRDLIGTAP